MPVLRRNPFIALAVLLGLSLPYSLRADTIEIDGIQWKYSVANGEATIEYVWISAEEAIAVPQTLDGYPVTCIGSSAFWDCAQLTSITIPNSVTFIDQRAFANCSGLTSITIPNSVTNIGDEAFAGCSGLTSITIPNSVSNIGNAAFYLCSGLTSITIPNSVSNIGEDTFFNCYGLTSITIPNGVTSIGHEAFAYCSGLTSIMIPNSVTNIGSVAFRECSKLSSITIPDSVTSIGYSAFLGCSGLTSITISEGVTSLEGSVFAGCSGLTSITIPNSVTNIGWNAFEGCSGLTSITIPDSVENIGLSPFLDCHNLTEAWVPQSVMTKGLSSVFESHNLQRLHLSANVSTIDTHEFADCNALTSIDVASGNENFWVSPADGCLYDAGRKTVFFCPRNATSVELPEGLEKVSDHAFNNCEDLPSIDIPDSVTSIPITAFDGCTALWTSWYRTLANLSSGGGGSVGVNPATRISFTATNVVLHYVASAVPSGAVTPPTAEGLVNVVTEIGASRAIAVSSDWAAQYPGFENLYGTDFGAAIVAENGKTDGAGHPMFVWQDYVAGTNPTDPADAFTASIAFDATTGDPVIGWSPELPAAEAAKRVYTVFGKVRLNDESWTEVDGDAADYNFFKVRVEMK